MNNKGIKVTISILIVILVIFIVLVSIFLSKYVPLQKEMKQLVWEELRIYNPTLVFDGIEKKTGYKIARYRVEYFENYVVIVEYDGLKINYIGVEEEENG